MTAKRILATLVFMVVAVGASAVHAQQSPDPRVPLGLTVPRQIQQIADEVIE